MKAVSFSVLSDSLDAVDSKGFAARHDVACRHVSSHTGERSLSYGVHLMARGPTMAKLFSLRRRTTTAQDAARIGLGLLLVFAGTSHLTFARKPFRAQVPPWMPLDEDTVVLMSGVGEIALGTALLATPERYRRIVGCAAAGFFTAILPGNIAQYQRRRDAFGLDTDGKRLGRLFFQPALVAWALWSTDATAR
jgi:uncharacterized membrane protein